MAWMLLPARPNAADLIAVCEAVVIKQHGAAALGRSSGSSVEFNVAEAKVRGASVLFGPAGRALSRMMGGGESKLRASITSDPKGWMIVAEGRNVAAQFELLRGIADYAVTKRWIDESVADELQRALDSA